MSIEVAAARVLRIANDHVAKFRHGLKMAELGDRSWNAEECEHYLRIWSGILRKEGKWSLMAPFEKREVLEAIDAEDVDTQEMEVS